MHSRAHTQESGTRGDVRIARHLPLKSIKMRLYGVGDVVEFHRPTDRTSKDHIAHVPGLSGEWTVFPVEYKSGGPKSHDADKVQLCAQAMCLEEMLSVIIDSGVLFYGRTKRRAGVTFDRHLRDKTMQTAQSVREMFTNGITPPARYVSKKCRPCSLKSECMPKRMDFKTPVAEQYLDRMIHNSLKLNTVETEK